MYEDMRYFGAAEACWRLFSFKLFEKQPPVERLPIHLDGEVQVTYAEGNEEQAAEDEMPASAFLDWLSFCVDAPAGTRLPNNVDWRTLTYIQFPGYFHYEKRNRCWRPLGRQASTRYRKIGRLPAITLRGNEELFYLRLLLGRLTCADVAELAAAFGQSTPVPVSLLYGTHSTFKDACIERGLAGDDREWELALAEARISYNWHQLRELFLWIMVFNAPTYPERLFAACWTSMMPLDDAYYRALPAHADRLNLLLTDLQQAAMVQDMAHALEGAGLQADEARRRLPALSGEQARWLADVEGFNRAPRVLQAEMNYTPRREREQFLLKVEQIDQQPSQRLALRAIQDQYLLGSPGVVFLDAPAGSGKTFLLQTLLHMVRADGEIAIAVSSTGITALLLEGGSTLHSKLKVPIDINSESTLNINHQSALAKVIRAAKLLIWEEAVMHNVHLLDAIDRSFKDLREDRDTLFGGLLVVMAGDLCASSMFEFSRAELDRIFTLCVRAVACSRQVLPIEPRAGRAQIVSLCLHQWINWDQVNVIRLEENMRAQRLLSSAVDDAERDRIRAWAAFLRAVGDGDELIAMPDDSEEVELDRRMCKGVASEADVLSMIDWIYGANPFQNDWRFWSKRAVVTPRHMCADYVNDLMLSRSPEPEIECLSADFVNDDNGQRGWEMPTDFLQKQAFGNLPPHRLRLKKGAVVMLLRNLDPSRGLSNGVRMIVEQVQRNRFLKCRIITGSREGDVVLIPRIKLSPPKSRLPVAWTRLQFPVKVSYCMTINKSQVRWSVEVGRCTGSMHASSRRHARFVFCRDRHWSASQFF